MRILLYYIKYFEHTRLTSTQNLNTSVLVTLMITSTLYMVSITRTFVLLDIGKIMTPNFYRFRTLRVIWRFEIGKRMKFIEKSKIGRSNS